MTIRKGVLGQAVPPLGCWYRGRASQKGDLIVLTQLEQYSLLGERQVGFDLGSVHSPERAVWFAERYGLLGTGESRSLMVASMANRTQLPDAQLSLTSRTVSEPYAAFASAAEDIRRIVGIIVDVRTATQETPNAEKRRQQADALARLWRKFEPDPADRQRCDDRTMLAQMSHQAALQLTIGLTEDDARPGLFDPAAFASSDPGRQPGRLEFAVVSNTLRGYCYSSLALRLASEPIERCPGCGNYFPIEDGRQRFCTPACANRSRYRAWLPSDQPGAVARRAALAAKQQRRETGQGRERPPTGSVSRTATRGERKGR